MNKKVNLGKVTGKYNNNLAFMQFLSAVFVILSHAYPIACNQNDILIKLTNGRIGLGDLAVRFFFLTGGFYIAKSMEKNKSAKKFFSIRIMRIFPPLIVIVTASVMMGCVLSEYTFAEYWSSIKTWKYFLNSVFILQHELPGVFQNNPYNPTVNGSLWTLPVEVACYIACFLFYKLKLLTNKFYISIP